MQHRSMSFPLYTMDNTKKEENSQSDEVSLARFRPEDEATVSQLHLDKQCTVTLIGTNHFFNHSAQVVDRCIESLRPDAVVLELDIDRFLGLMVKKNITSFANIEELVYFSPDREYRMTATPKDLISAVMVGQIIDDEADDPSLPSSPIESEAKEATSSIGQQQQTRFSPTFSRAREFMRNRLFKKVFSNKSQDKIGSLSQGRQQKNLSLYWTKLRAFSRRVIDRLGTRWMRFKINMEARMFEMLADKHNFEVNGEIVAAIEASEKYNVTRVILADESYEQTMRRYRQFLARNSSRNRQSIKEKLKVTNSMMDGSFFEPSFEALKGNTTSVNQYIEIETERLKKDDPAFFHAAVAERDMLFANAILGEVWSQKEEANIVAVMGALHRPGVEGFLSSDLFQMVSKFSFL
jgi:hypothetical protein